MSSPPLPNATVSGRHTLPPAPCILLIDDNPDDRALAIHTLRRHDPSVRFVEITTADACERALAEGAFDVVVTDYLLRWSDGLTVLRRVKEHLPDCPVIFFTDSGSEEVAVAAMKAGADDYVIKTPRRVRRLATAVQLARERAQLRAREQEALRLRDAFLLGAAHELRTPLTSLLGYLDLIQQRITTGKLVVQEQDRRMLEVIGRQGEILRRLAADLGDVARIGTGVLSLEWQSIDLVVLARQVLEELGPLLQAHSHTLELACPADALVIQGDPLRIEQAFQNVLDNAIKYSPGGGRVRVVLMRSGPHACLSVTDQGIGIPAAARAHVFERFYRGGNVNPLQLNGLGIGLYLTRALVEQHGGTITVESVEGQGSTFTLCLPLAQTETPPPMNPTT